eukprot:GILK01008297.1.p1 GENE.GILK01008297.1~~GILK01008297.1.p1  ORF type:complete len:487 (+),score=73.15 GILK01008297.1:41-1501(+)
MFHVSVVLNKTCPSPSIAIPGVPCAEERIGQLHLYRDISQSNPLNARRKVLPLLPIQRAPKLCILAVPSWITDKELSVFFGSFASHIRQLIVVSEEPNDLSNNANKDTKYSVFLEFDGQETADQFYEIFNGRLFSESRAELCYVMFITEAKFLEQHAESPINTVELPTCPVCVERLDVSVSGIVTIVCSHSSPLTCVCRTRWKHIVKTCGVCIKCPTFAKPLIDSPSESPVHTHTSPTTVGTGGSETVFCCANCSHIEGLWVCLICAQIGCGRYEGGHARDHFLDSMHTYAVEIGTQRVWDYLGDCYVHRLIRSARSSEPDVVFNLPDASERVTTQPSEKQIREEIDLVAVEYDHVLTSQLEEQRKYFEEKIESRMSNSPCLESIKACQDRIRTLNEQTHGLANTIATIQREKKALERRAHQLSGKIKTQEEDIKFQQEVHESLLANHAQIPAAPSSSKHTMDQVRRMKELQNKVSQLMSQIEEKK